MKNVERPIQTSVALDGAVLEARARSAQLHMRLLQEMAPGIAKRTFSFIKKWHLAAVFIETGNVL